MTYNPNIPQPTDLPSDSQPDIESNFLRLNEIFGEDHIPFGNLISDATLSAPIICTSPNHRLTTGDTVTVFNMEGINELEIREDWPINGASFTVTVIDEDTFSLDTTDSTAYPPYLADSGDFSSATLPYGFHIKNFFPSPVLQTPNRAAPKSAYFTQNINNLAELFFQNDSGAANIFRLTNLVKSAQTIRGIGFITPWGLKINMGDVVGASSAFTTFDFPLPFDSLVYSFTLTRGRLFENQSGQIMPVGNAISLTQFQVQMQSSSAVVSGHIFYLAVGV